MDAIRRRRATWILAAALLAALPPPPAPAATATQELAGQEIALVGQLLADDLVGSYLLVERSGGDAIVLRGPRELADHVGALVRVTGEWGEDDDGERYFRVWRIERV